MTGRKHHLLRSVPLALALGVGAWWVFREAEGPRVEALAPVRRPMV